MWLREEARETWDHIIGDVLVYATERAIFNSFPRPVTELYSYRSGYIWLELRINAGNADYIAILEKDVDAPITDHLISLPTLWHEVIRQRISPSQDRNSPMLVDDVKSMQGPQQLKACVVPSPIRLQRLDFVLRRRREFLNSARASFDELGFGDIDRELDIGLAGFRSGRNFQVGESAGKVVKGAAEVVDGVSNEHGDRIEDRWVEPKLSAEFRRWYAVTDSLQSAWITRPRSPAMDLGIKGVEVFLRPIDLEPYTVRNHPALYSGRGQGQTAETADLKGARNSHSAARRVPSPPQEDGKGQALNSAPPLPSTSPPEHLF